MPIENGDATATGPMFVTVLGVETALPVRAPEGAETDAMMRSGRLSRIVTVETFALLTAALTGSLSTTENARLPLRAEAFCVRIGTVNGLAISPAWNVTTVLVAV